MIPLAICIGEFKKLLYDEGLDEIGPKEGESFDTDLHEAVEVVDGKETGKVAELVLGGWKYKVTGPVDRVIRHAKVKVFGEKGKN